MLRTASRLRTRQPARRSKPNNRILRRRRARCLERNRTRQLYTRTNRTLSGNFLYATTGRCAGVGTQFAITTNRRPRVTARRNTARCQWTKNDRQIIAYDRHSQLYILSKCFVGDTTHFHNKCHHRHIHRRTPHAIYYRGHNPCIFRWFGCRVLPRHQSHAFGSCFRYPFRIGSRMAVSGQIGSRRLGHSGRMGVRHGNRYHFYFHDPRLHTRAHGISFRKHSHHHPHGYIHLCGLCRIIDFLHRIAIQDHRIYGFRCRLCPHPRYQDTPRQLYHDIFVATAVVLTIRLVGIMLLISILSLPQWSPNFSVTNSEISFGCREQSISSAA